MFLLSASQFTSVSKSFFHIYNRFMKIVSVVLGGGQMALCLPTPGMAQYISIISCSYFQLRYIYIYIYKNNNMIIIYII